MSLGINQALLLNSFYRYFHQHPRPSVLTGPFRSDTQIYLIARFDAAISLCAPSITSIYRVGASSNIRWGLETSSPEAWYHHVAIPCHYSLVIGNTCFSLRPSATWICFCDRLSVVLSSLLHGSKGHEPFFASKGTARGWAMD